MARLLLFDIDGTLVLTGRAGGRAMWLAARDCFGLEEDDSPIPMAGRTDAWIAAQMAARAGADSEGPALERFRRRYLEHLAREIHQPGPRKGVLPGVADVLAAVHERPHARLGLLTGNCEGGARLKLTYFDLWRYFPAGAYGDAIHDRNQLLPVALERFQEVHGERVAPQDVVIIGDTPLDVAVAVAGGARSLGVATGDYSCEELKASGADEVLRDFGDLAAALKALKV